MLDNPDQKYTDSLGYPLLSREQQEFLEDRGYLVIINAVGSQVASRPPGSLRGLGVRVISS